MDTPQSKLSRRRFLLAAGVGSAAATAALVAGKDGAPDSKPEKTAREGQGYHVTEHILSYYRTTKI